MPVEQRTQPGRGKVKLSFSTLGCPGWSLGEVIDGAVRYGYSGVELRGINGELDIRKLEEFSAQRIAQSRRLFEDAGLEIVSVDSSASFSHKEADKLHASVEEARDYIVLASELGAPIVRVFGGFIPDGVTFADGAAQLASHLSDLGDFARAKGVIVALETHDSFLTGKVVAEVMRLVDHEAVGVVWDVSNSFWADEPLEETIQHLVPHIKLVHIKDAIWQDGEAKLTFIGEGGVPLQKALKLLAGMEYDGYLSYEWEKVWQPSLPEPEAAFPQYVAKMREYLGR
jgi:sugar phosphate isomerase/epimerase